MSTQNTAQIIYNYACLVLVCGVCMFVWPQQQQKQPSNIINLLRGVQIPPPTFHRKTNTAISLSLRFITHCTPTVTHTLTVAKPISRVPATSSKESSIKNKLLVFFCRHPKYSSSLQCNTQNSNQSMHLKTIRNNFALKVAIHATYDDPASSLSTLINPNRPAQRKQQHTTSGTSGKPHINDDIALTENEDHLMLKVRFYINN